MTRSSRVASAARHTSRASRKRTSKTPAKADTEPPPVINSLTSRLTPKPLVPTSLSPNTVATAQNILTPVASPAPPPVSARQVTLPTLPSLQDLLNRANTQYQQDYQSTYGTPAPGTPGLNVSG